MMYGTRNKNIGSRWRAAQLLLSALALTLSFGAPAALAQQAAQQTAKGPKLELLVRELDFGDITRGQTVEASFELKNVGDEPLKVVKVKPG